MFRRSPARAIGGLVVIALCIAPSVGEVRAQSTHVEASIRAQQARAAARRSEMLEAIRLYRESIAMNPEPHVFHEFADVLERQGIAREAATMWSRFAAMAPSGEERTNAIARSESLRRLPSLLRVRVSPALAARLARVWFDHDVPRTVPVGGAESLVEGGVHRVRVESPGYVPFEASVSTAYGEQTELVARLVTMPANGDRAGLTAGDAAVPPASQMPAMPMVARDR